MCPLSVAEITFKWQRGRLKDAGSGNVGASFAEHFVLENPSATAAQQAGQWSWGHGDLVNRVLAAIAKEQNLLLLLRYRFEKLTGFPQKYFPNVTE